MEARRTHSASVEAIPTMTTRAVPLVALAGCPAAERTSDTRAGGVELILVLDLTLEARAHSQG